VITSPACSIIWNATDRPRPADDAVPGHDFDDQREVGVRQFLDIRTGLPAANNTHEVAQRAAPESRIVSVGNDPIVLAPAGPADQRPAGGHRLHRGRPAQYRTDPGRSRPAPGLCRPIAVCCWPSCRSSRTPTSGGAGVAAAAHATRQPQPATAPQQPRSRKRPGNGPKAARQRPENATATTARKLPRHHSRRKHSLTCIIFECHFSAPG
jgi:hypothetical protein